MPTHGSSLFNNTIFLPNFFSSFFYRLLLNSQKIASSQKCRKFCHQVQLTNLEGKDFRKYIIASFAIYLRYTGILRPISATLRPLLLWHHPLSIEIGIFTWAKWQSLGPACDDTQFWDIPCSPNVWNSPSWWNQIFYFIQSPSASKFNSILTVMQVCTKIWLNFVLPRKNEMIFW